MPPVEPCTFEWRQSSDVLISDKSKGEMGVKGEQNSTHTHTHIHVHTHTHTHTQCVSLEYKLPILHYCCEIIIVVVVGVVICWYCCLLCCLVACMLMLGYLLVVGSSVMFLRHWRTLRHCCSSWSSRCNSSSRSSLNFSSSFWTAEESAESLAPLRKGKR